MPKATYMYWQKRFDRGNPDQEIEGKVLEIREEHKNYGYRRILGDLRNQGYSINKKKVQRIVQKLGLQVTSYTRKSRKYSSYRGKVGTIAPNRIHRRFRTHIPHQKITTDTSEFKYYEVNEKGRMTMHKLYLDPFMDMCNGEIISFGIDDVLIDEVSMFCVSDANAGIDREVQMTERISRLHKNFFIINPPKTLYYMYIIHIHVTYVNCFFGR